MLASAPLLLFGLLLFEVTLAVALDPALQVVRGLLQLVGVDEAAAEGLEEGARADVVGELVVGLVRRALGRGDEQFFVERGEPALDAAQRQTALARDRPVREAEREVAQGLGLELGQER